MGANHTILGFQSTAWTEKHVPASATQATCTKTAPGIGKRLVITSINASIAAATTVQTPILVELLEGSTQIMAWKVAAPANGLGGLAMGGLAIVLGVNSACTLRFSAAGVSASEQAVCLSGYVVQ